MYKCPDSQSCIGLTQNQLWFKLSGDVLEEWRPVIGPNTIAKIWIQTASKWVMYMMFLYMCVLAQGIGPGAGTDKEGHCQ